MENPSQNIEVLVDLHITSIVLHKLIMVLNLNKLLMFFNCKFYIIEWGEDNKTELIGQLRYKCNKHLMQYLLCMWV